MEAPTFLIHTLDLFISIGQKKFITKDFAHGRVIYHIRYHKGKLDLESIELAIYLHRFRMNWRIGKTVLRGTENILEYSRI